MTTSQTSNHKGSILIVDDEIAFCTVIREILRTAGFHVRIAHRASEALELLDDIVPDLILTDIMMPEMDGISLIREIRRRAGFSSTPILVVTAKSQIDDYMGAHEAGANEILTKPFTSQELLSLIQLHINGAHH